jgi:hypothetical protein
LTTEVRVGIAIGWSTVSGPAGVTYPDMGVLDWACFKIRNQNRKLARSLSSLQTGLGVNHRDARGVVASIFQAL